MVKLDTTAIAPKGQAIEVDIRTQGNPEKDAERVHMAMHDMAVRAMQAQRDGVHPDECDGIGIVIDWDRVIGEEVEG